MNYIYDWATNLYKSAKSNKNNVIFSANGSALNIIRKRGSSVTFMSYWSPVLVFGKDELPT
jgi:hypothetical protein